MNLTSVVNAVAGWSARKVTVRPAGPEDEEQVHRFNYEIFVEELGQHPANPERRLVDKHHERNTYFLARKGERVIGMVAVTRPGPDGFSVQGKMANPEVLDPYRNDGVEVRLLAVRRSHRGLGVFWKLAQAAVRHIVAGQAEHVFISGIERNLALYRRFGFEPMGPPVRCGRNSFVPMRVTRAGFRPLCAALGLRYES